MQFLLDYESGEATNSKRKCLASTPVDKHIEAMICGDRCYIKRKDTEAISMLWSSTSIMNFHRDNYHPQIPISSKSPVLCCLLVLMHVILQ